METVAMRAKRSVSCSFLQSKSAVCFTLYTPLSALNLVINSLEERRSEEQLLLRTCLFGFGWKAGGERQRRCLLGGDGLCGWWMLMVGWLY
jgi:hypothetical protein